MKRNILTSGFLILATFAFGQQIKVSGNIVNPAGDSVFLYQYHVENNRNIEELIAAASVNLEGKFELTFETEASGEYSFAHGDESTKMLLDPGDDIQMYLNPSFFDETIKYSGKGSMKNNAVATLYLVQEVIQMNAFSNLDGADTTSLFKKIDQAYEDYAALVKDYNASVSGFKSYGDELISGLEYQIPQMKKYLAREIGFKARMNKLIGNQAIDFEGIDLAGNRTKLSDYKGKVTVVDFWATWCGPCKAEFPAYKELEKKYGEDVNFVSVAMSCKEDEWKKMATDEGFAHNIYLSKEDVKQIKDYEVYGIPRYLVLDENFNLIDANAPRPSSGELPAFWE